MSIRLAWTLNALLAIILVGAIWKMSRAPAPAAVFDSSRSVIEIMESIVDPAADFLWNSVSYEVTVEGSTENVPKTPAQWLAVRRSALQLLEATNLLRIQGRPVAPVELIPNWVEQPMAKGNLRHPAVQALIDEDPAEFGRHAQGLANGATLAIRAVDERNIDNLFVAGGVIYQGCETCHLRYWYPPAASGGVPVR